MFGRSETAPQRRSEDDTSASVSTGQRAFLNGAIVLAGRLHIAANGPRQNALHHRGRAEYPAVEVRHRGGDETARIDHQKPRNPFWVSDRQPCRSKTPAR